MNKVPNGPEFGWHLFKIDVSSRMGTKWFSLSSLLVCNFVHYSYHMVTWSDILLFNGVTSLFEDRFFFWKSAHVPIVYHKMWIQWWDQREIKAKSNLKGNSFPSGHVLKIEESVSFHTWKKFILLQSMTKVLFKIDKAWLNMVGLKNCGHLYHRTDEKIFTKMNKNWAKAYKPLIF